jgi:hypothetical protein
VLSVCKPVPLTLLLAIIDTIDITATIDTAE